MKNSILTKFFTGYFSFAILGFLLISYWSNNLIYNHLLTNNINTLYKYASVIGSNAVDRQNYNKPKAENPKQFKCPPEKEKAIREALKYFKMI